MKTTTHPSVDDIVAALRREAGELDLDPEGARLFIAVLRALSQASALTPETLVAIATESRIPAEKLEVLDWVAEKSGQGDIVGLAGLSLNEWNHGFRVGGRRLTTWCALDPLYLTPLLQQTTQVESRDPVTQDPIRLSVAPDGVRAADPGTTVISIVIPSVKEKGLHSAEQIWNAFCSYSHFFTSEENGRAWFEGKEIDPIFLTLEEGFELGKKWFEKVGRAIPEGENE